MLSAHMLNRVIKNIMKRVINKNSVDCFQGSCEQCEVQPYTSEGNGRRERGIKKINDYPDKVCGAASTCVCAKDISEKKWDKLCVR